MTLTTQTPGVASFPFPVRLPLLSLAFLAGLVTAPVAHAAVSGVAPVAVMTRADGARVQTIADETVNVVATLIEIQRDLLLGQLFTQEGMAGTEESHFAHPRAESLPHIKDALAKAGAPDLEPLLIALEQATDQKDVDAAYIAALTGVKKAKEVLAPTEHDLLQAIVVASEESLSLLDPSGKTDVARYQKAWGLLMAARGELDILVFSRDPAVKQIATRMALAFDEVVMLAPDPAAKSPAQFDPALVSTMIATLKGQMGSI